MCGHASDAFLYTFDGMVEAPAASVTAEIPAEPGFTAPDREGEVYTHGRRTLG